MSGVSGRTKPNSGASLWSAPIFPMIPAAGAEDWPAALTPQPLRDQAVRASLMGVETIEACLTASRRMIDLWRTNVREQQDAMLAGWRAQLESSLAHEDEAAQRSEQARIAASAPASRPGSRPRSTQSRKPEPA
jgi:hypothetical protein